jgi:tRNA (cytidine/uridine-2'-O-)-methyltransferase
MDIVLVHPEIPGNTGNVGRTCVATGTPLHLVKPLGFQIDDKNIRRSGLDYWKDLNLTVHESLKDFLRSGLTERPVFLFSRFAKQSFWCAEFPEDSVLIFGCETRGLPAPLKRKFKSHLFKIPMSGPVRSLNLSSSVAVALYEALRQQEVRTRPLSRRGEIRGT